MSDEKYTLYLIHSLAQTSMIRLHQPFLADDLRSKEQCVRAARSISHIVKHISGTDMELLDPLIGVSISTARP
jgi:hypothetical protein